MVWQGIDLRIEAREPARSLAAGEYRVCWGVAPGRLDADFATDLGPLRLVAARPATHAILTELEVGECSRQCFGKNSVSCALTVSTSTV